MPDSVVLLVEDDRATREMYATWLRDAGLVVVEARDGSQAAALFAASPPDLILTDLNMPCMDGAGLCRRVRASSDAARLPVVGVTGQMSGDSLKVIADAGFCGLLCKPCDPDGLVALVAVLLARRAQCAGCWEQEGRLRVSAMAGSASFWLRAACPAGREE